jgi:kynureninase
VSTPPILALAPLRASFDLFDRVGMEALMARSVRLTAYLEWLLDRQGIGPLITPREADQRGAMLTLRTSRDASAIERELGDRGAVVDARGKDLLRIAPAPLYTSYADLEAFVGVLADVVGAPAAH